LAWSHIITDHYYSVPQLSCGIKSITKTFECVTFHHIIYTSILNFSAFTQKKETNNALTSFVSSDLRIMPDESEA